MDKLPIIEDEVTTLTAASQGGVLQHHETGCRRHCWDESHKPWHLILQLMVLDMCNYFSHSTGGRPKAKTKAYKRCPQHTVPRKIRWKYKMHVRILLQTQAKDQPWAHTHYGGRDHTQLGMCHGRDVAQYNISRSKRGLNVRYSNASCCCRSAWKNTKHPWFKVMESERVQAWPWQFTFSQELTTGA